MRSISTSRVDRRSERGFALVSAIFALSVALLLLMTVSVQTLNTNRMLDLRLTYQGQALNVANAGLVEGLDWFRRQENAVTTFDPQRDLSANPPVDDTDVVTDPPSITRDYLISLQGRVWGRYVVQRGDPDTSTGVFDISQHRRGSGAPAGTMWQLESVGYVYIRNDPAGAFDAAPNRVIARRTVRTEIQRVGLNVAGAAISITQGNRTRIGNSGTSARVVGSSAGIGVAYRTAGSSPSGPRVTSPAILSGTPASAGQGSLPDGVPLTVFEVFNVNSIGDLGAIADINVTTVAALPPTLPPMQLIVLDVGAGNTATFDSTRPLTGSGILVVNGNLTITGGPSSYNGVIYVTGTYRQVGPSSVYGAVLAAGSSSEAYINGTGGDFAQVFYDPFMINQVSVQLGKFKFSRPAYVPCPPTDPDCNSRIAER